MAETKTAAELLNDEFFERVLAEVKWATPNEPDGFTRATTYRRILREKILERLAQ